MTPLVAFITGIAAGAAALLTGAAITRRIAVPASSPKSNEHVAVDQMAAKLGALFQWTDSFARDMSDYQVEMDETARQCHIETDGQSAQPKTLLEILSRICEVNDRLKLRLDAAEKQLQHQREALAKSLLQARTDGLTELSNRRAFDDELRRRLAEWRRYGSPIALALVDVDHFKSVNDNYGHLVGDQILREVAASLKKAARESDYVARFGGEEFAILLLATPAERARVPVERARRAVEKVAVEHDGRSLRVTVSCGATQAMPGDDAARLIGRAEEALYAAKAAGRNNSHWHNGKQCVPLHGTKKTPICDAEACQNAGSTSLCSTPN